MIRRRRPAFRAGSGPKILYPRGFAIGFRTALCLLCGLLCLLAGERPALAQNSIYSVGGVAVDASAATATEARDTAIAEGHLAAWQRLFQRLVVAEDLPRLPALTADQITGYVQDFSVINERSSPGRYLADFTFRFNRKAVRSLFQQYNVRFAEVRSKPIVVLPVFGPDEGAVLWREPNPWRAAWAEQSLDQGLVPFVAPLGDLSDMSGISAAQAAAGDAERLKALATRYGAAESLVTRAMLSEGSAETGGSLQVITGRSSGAAVNWSPRVTFVAAPGETPEALMQRAARSTAAGIEAAWKRRNLLNFGTRRNLVVSVPIATLADWLEVRRRLETVPSILTSSVMFLRRDRGQISLTFIGDESQLTLALRQSDLVLTRQNGAPPPTIIQSGTTATPGLTLSGAAGVGAGSAVSPPSGQWELRLLSQSGAVERPGPARSLAALPSQSRDRQQGVE